MSLVFSNNGRPTGRVRFLQYGDFQGRQFPSRIAVLYGDTEYGVFDILSIETTPTSEAAKQ